MTVVSLEQRYTGHAAQVLALVAQVPGGAHYTKWIIAVDEDVDPTNMDEVIWAMASRCHPIEDIDILRNTWSTWLDPTQNPPENRPYGSKALINACKDTATCRFSPNGRRSEKAFTTMSRRAGRSSACRARSPRSKLLNGKPKSFITKEVALNREVNPRNRKSK